MLRSKSFALLSLVIICQAFAGCLTDNITAPQVKPRLVLPPARVTFFSPESTYVAATNSGDMVVKWTRSPADTQLNFKGYFIKVYTSDTVGSTAAGVPNQEILHDSIRSAHLLRVQGQLDTTYTFTAIPFGRYTAVVWGEKATDTLGYSLDSTMSTIHIFDPRPIANPSSVAATSHAENMVLLKWKRSTGDTNVGFLGYEVFYQDTLDIDKNKADTARAVLFQALTADSANPGYQIGTVTVPNNDPAKEQYDREHPYRFWVMSLRRDSVYTRTDSAVVTWAGAVHLNISPKTYPDTSFHNLFRQSLAVDQQNGQYVLNDSDLRNAEFTISSDGQNVTLTATNGAAFLKSTADTASSLDNIFYTQMFPDASQFNVQSVTFPVQAYSGGLVYYIKMNDVLGNSSKGPEFARVFVAAVNGVYADPTGGLSIQVSFQPGTTNDGSRHLQYY